MSFCRVTLVGLQWCLVGIGVHAVTKADYGIEQRLQFPTLDPFSGFWPFANISRTDIEPSCSTF
ncbi:hypothetical protein ABEB36_010316 [Hypothenemus hampei]|uniref:Secreted protein n=1 Tax=Hypothenemus hampei TaxID=57062 RepID=A0ABD1EJG3_HYPHA